jgi:hypothetical protein
MVFIPTLLFIIIGASKRSIKKRNDFRIYLGSLFDGILHYLYSYEIEKRLSKSLEDGFLALNQLGYFVCIVFTYLISDKFPRGKIHLLTYLILLICAITLTCYEKRVYSMAIEQFIGSTGISILLLPTHLVLCNIIANETGVLNLIFLKSPIIVIMCILHFRGFTSKDFSLLYTFTTSNFLFIFFYLSITVAVLFGCSIYTQKYGIVSMGMLSVSNFVFYRFLNMFMSGQYRIMEIIVFGVLYLVFLSTSNDFKKRTNTAEIPQPLVT